MKVSISGYEGKKVVVTAEQGDVDKGHGILQNATFYKDVEGKTVCKYDDMVVKGQEEGTGIRMFSEAVGHMQNHGVDRVEGKGQGFKGDPGGYNSYITWPKMGFNGELTPKFKEMRSSSLGDSDTHDLNGLIEKYGDRGMNSWADYGSTFRGTFDLKSGSKSMETLNEYRSTSGVS